MVKIKRKDVSKLIAAYCKQENIIASVNNPCGNVLVTFEIRSKIKKCTKCNQEIKE